MEAAAPEAAEEPPRQLGAYVPASMRDAFYELARRNHRSVSDELRLCVEQHLARAKAEEGSA